MRKVIQLFVTGLLLGLATQAMGDQTMPPDIVAHYIPFGVETYLPVTMANVEKDAWFRFEDKKTSSNAMKIQELLSDKNVTAITNHKFDEQRVRLKIRGLCVEDIFVDAEGIFVFKNKTHQISIESKSKLDVLLRSIGQKLKSGVR